MWQLINASEKNYPPGLSGFKLLWRSDTLASTDFFSSSERATASCTVYYMLENKRKRKRKAPLESKNLKIVGMFSFNITATSVTSNKPFLVIIYLKNI